MDTHASNVRTWSMLCHLAALAGFLFWLGGVLGPLIVWQIKKNELPEIDDHGKEAVNFQLTVFIINVVAKIILVGSVGVGVLWGSPWYGIGNGFGILTLVGILNLVAYVLAIIAGIRANNGEFYKYPFSIRFIK